MGSEELQESAVFNQGFKKRQGAHDLRSPHPCWGFRCVALRLGDMMVGQSRRFVSRQGQMIAGSIEELARVDASKQLQPSYYPSSTTVNNSQQQSTTGLAWSCPQIF